MKDKDPHQVFVFSQSMKHFPDFFKNLFSILPYLFSLFPPPLELKKNFSDGLGRFSAFSAQSKKFLRRVPRF